MCRLLSPALQFSEWIVGPYLALKYNLTYVWSALGYQSVGWNSFLGLSTGELTREQINSTGALRVRELPAPTKQNPRVEHEVWLQQQLAEEHARRQTDGAGAANSTAPTPLLLHLQEPAIRVMQRMCLPALRSVVRRKYCEARLAHPVSENLFEEDRAAGRLVVAWHLRCGNSCFNPLRATPLDSVLRTTLQMQRILARLSPDREVAWHIFTQPPQNMTAEAHFGPMLEKMKPHLTHLRTHWHDSAQVVFHHLVQSGPQSARDTVAVPLLICSRSLADSCACSLAACFTVSTRCVSRFVEFVFVAGYGSSPRTGRHTRSRQLQRKYSIRSTDG